MSPNVKTKTRSSKILLTSLSIAAGISGWAWLTVAQPPAQGQADLANETPEPIQAVATPMPVQVSAAAALPPRSNIPNLADLPVRGLREVGDAVPNPVPPNSGEPPPPSVVQRNQGGGGGKAIAQPQPQPQPQPKPKPTRKAKSSH